MSAKRPGLFLYIAVLLLAAAAALLRPASPEGLFRTDIYGMVPGLPDPAEEEFTRRIAGEAVFLLEGKDMSAVLRKARELRDLVTKDGAVGIRLISPEESASFIFAHRYSYAPPPEIEKEGLARYILGILYSPFSAVSAGEIKKDPLFAARSAATSRPIWPPRPLSKIRMVSSVIRSVPPRA